jgi:uncharacterized protein involved in tolerance to divalent cations
MQDVPSSYQHILNRPPTEEQCQEIAHELTQDTLVACSDGAYDKNTSIVSHRWVFASSLSEYSVIEPS